MNPLITAYDAIGTASKHPSADTEMLQSHIGKLYEAVEVAITLGALTSGDQAKVAAAYRRAQAAIWARRDAAHASTIATLAGLDPAVWKRWTFETMHSRSMLKSIVTSGIMEIDHQQREQALTVNLIVDGETKGWVARNGIFHPGGDRLKIVYNAYDCDIVPYDSIVAASDANGLAMVTRSGSVIEIRQP